MFESFTGVVPDAQSVLTTFCDSSASFTLALFLGNGTLMEKGGHIVALASFISLLRVPTDV